MPAMVDVRLLLQFHAVAEELSFTAAARRLGVAQPWLSARIRKLESMLGAQLFERSSRRVALTPLGHELEALVRPLATTAAEVLAGVEALRADADSRLRIGCPMLGEPDAQQAALITDFAADHPRVSVEVEPGSSATQADNLRGGLLDLVLTIWPPPGPEWETLRLHSIELAVMMHADNPLAEIKTLRMQDLSDHRLAALARRRAPAQFDELYGPILAAGGRVVEVPELRRSLLRDDPTLIVSTFVPAPANADLRYGIVRRALADAPPLWLHLVRRRLPHQGRAAQRFWAWAAKARTDVNP